MSGLLVLVHLVFRAKGDATRAPGGDAGSGLSCYGWMMQLDRWTLFVYVCQAASVAHLIR